MNRRSVALGLPWATAGLARLSLAQAQPVMVIVPFAAGGSTDLVARMLAPRLHADLGQAFVVENVPGAGGALGLDKAVTARPDGNTLLLAGSEIARTSVATGGTLKSLIPVSLVASAPIVLLAGAGSRVGSLRSITQMPPGKPLTISANGYAELLVYKRLERGNAGTFEFVPYKGAAPLLQDLQVGALQLGLVQAAAAQAAVRSGRAIALATSEPLSWAPDTPLFPPALVPAGAILGIYGLYAPACTPGEAVRRLEAAVHRALQGAALKEELLARGFVARGGTAGELAGAIKTIAALLPDPCKVTTECEKDPTCPKPCP